MEKNSACLKGISCSRIEGVWWATTEPLGIIATTRDSYQKKVVVPCNSSSEVWEYLLMSNNVGVITVLAMLLILFRVLLALGAFEMKRLFEVCNDLSDCLTGNDTKASNQGCFIGTREGND